MRRSLRSHACLNDGSLRSPRAHVHPPIILLLVLRVADDFPSMCTRFPLRVCPSPPYLVFSTSDGTKYQVRIVSDIDDIDVTLPLLPCRPPEEVEGDAQEACDVPPEEESKGAPPPKEQPLSASENTKKVSPPQEPPKEAGAQGVDEEPCEVASTETGDPSVWEEREVPASEESFFFNVPPLPKPVRFANNLAALRSGRIGNCAGDCRFRWILRSREKVGIFRPPLDSVRS